MAKAVMGSDKVLYFRKLGEAEAGTLVLQTEHSVSASREKESTKTKFGNVESASTLEEELSISALQAHDDPMNKTLKNAVYHDYPLEVWEVNLNKGKPGTDGQMQYEAEYRQGNMTSWERSSGEEAETVEGTFVTHGVYKEGLVTLSPDQIVDLSYVFHDLTPSDVADDGLAQITSPAGA